LVLIPVSLLPTFFQMAGGLYFIAALALGLDLRELWRALRRTKSAPRHGKLFWFRLPIFPLLLAAMMLNKQ